MKNPELFHKTISILVKAYQNDTLEHGNCMACAVGNLVKANLPKARMSLSTGWPTVLVTYGFGQVVSLESYKGSAKKQVDSTGYSVKELALIEYSFENVKPDENKDYNSDQHQLDGLLAVVDALMIIHEATKEEAEEAKLLFVK
jgi:hypothetical protein